VDRKSTPSVPTKRDVNRRRVLENIYRLLINLAEESETQAGLRNIVDVDQENVGVSISGRTDRLDE
jgi:hypothetical protein